MRELITFWIGIAFNSEVKIPTCCPRCDSRLQCENEGCVSCGLRLWQDVPILIMRYRQSVVLFIALAAAFLVCLYVWARYPGWLPYVGGIFLIETIWGVWVMRHQSRYVGVISPDGVFTIEQKKIVSNIPWPGITGFKPGRWAWQVEVLTAQSGNGQHTLNLWTPTLAREFSRVAADVHETRIRTEEMS